MFSVAEFDLAGVVQGILESAVITALQIIWLFWYNCAGEVRIQESE